MKKSELVFIPSPGLGHLICTVEMAKFLLQKDDRISVTVLIMRLPNDTVLDSYIQNISDPSSRLRLINLPDKPEVVPRMSEAFVFDLIDSEVIPVRHILSNLIESSDSQLAGIVVDMFCTPFIDVANELGLNSYSFFTSSVACLGLFLHLASLVFEHNQDLTQNKSSDAVLRVPYFSIPVPVKVFPSVLLDNAERTRNFLGRLNRLRETKGIMVNSFSELESYAVQALSSDENTPKIYPVGPILNFKNDDQSSNDNDIIDWLENQLDSSVVFLCFGSVGTFHDCQVKEIANALENSGIRFLWSLRRPQPKGIMEYPKEYKYDDLEQVLPQGFLERMKEVGKVIGWAPQMAILSHRALGGFVSHCGWNSTLESLWCGVPMATWPMYAEQQLNAFQFVKELGIAEAIRIDYVRDFMAENPVDIVRAEEIELGISRLMAANGKNELRNKVMEMKNKSRMALQEGGSSYTAQTLFIEDVINSLPS